MSIEYYLNTSTYIVEKKALNWLYKNYHDFWKALQMSFSYYEPYNRTKILTELSLQLKGYSFELHIHHYYEFDPPYSIFAFNGSYYCEEWSEHRFDLTKLPSYQHTIQQIETFETTKTAKKLGQHLRSEIKAIILEDFHIKQ